MNLDVTMGEVTELYILSTQMVIMLEIYVIMFNSFDF